MSRDEYAFLKSPKKGLAAVFHAVAIERWLRNNQRSRALQKRIGSRALLLNAIREAQLIDARIEDTLSNVWATLKFPPSGQVEAEHLPPTKDTAYLFGVGLEDTFTIMDGLENYDIIQIQNSENMRQLIDVDAAARGITFLLADIDALGELEDAVEELISFQERCPEIVVLIISAFVIKDDLEANRSMICSATLRTPLSIGRLINGMNAAKQNHLLRYSYRPQY